MNSLMNPTPTMTSLEIADLVDSNHADVRRSMERLAEKGVIALPPLAEVSNPGAGPKTIKVYLVCKRDSYVIVAQLSPEFTARLVDRWQELEAKAPTMDPMAALIDPTTRTTQRWTTRWARTAASALLQVPARLVDPVRALHLMNSETLPSPRRGFLVGGNGPAAAHKTPAPGHRK